MESKDFISVRVSTLRGDLKIGFDAYLKVAGKFILYCRQGDSFEGDRLSRLKTKKLKKMYIRLDEEDLYRQYMSQSIDMAFSNSSNKPIEIRTEVIQGAQQAVAEDLMEDPESEAFYEVAKNSSGRFAKFIRDEEKALKCLANTQNEDKSISHHGVTVASLAVGMAQKIGIDNEDDISKLVLGALIHDIEHQNEVVPLDLPRKDMTVENAAIYDVHPIEGAKRVKDLGFYDPSVVNIILQHEEFIDGSGFPKGLTEQQMDPLALIVATANSFDRMVSFYKIPPKEALKKLLIDRMGLHPLPHLKILQDILKDAEMFK